MRAAMTCPGLMIPGHVGLCYMPLDWTSACPCIFFAAHHGSVCLAQADCKTLASACFGSRLSSMRMTCPVQQVGLTAERLRCQRCDRSPGLQCLVVWYLVLPLDVGNPSETSHVELLQLHDMSVVEDPRLTVIE